MTPTHMMGAHSDIIVAPATQSGGAIAIVRVSGDGSIELADNIFRHSRGLSLCGAKGYTVHYGEIVDEEQQVVDDVLLTLFRAPHSYTSDDSVEISCHGSSYIVSRIIELILHRGARMATEGEFTTRAFLAGRLDLSQAEAVADMIASSNRAMHTLASTQMRGGYSLKLSTLRGELLHLSALMELELDFSEEDVEFANRDELRDVMKRLDVEILELCDSFKVGNAIKNGISVAIVGAPNAGKSTLLNRLLGEERAMVSEVAGTTRDTIEDVVVLGGLNFRFVDTAGLHETDDRLEKMGIERTHNAMARAQIVMQIIDISDATKFERIEVEEDQELIVVVNKVDLAVDSKAEALEKIDDAVYISAREGSGVDELIYKLCSTVDLRGLYRGDLVVSNSRHYSHLKNASNSLQRSLDSLNSHQSSDMIVEDLRHTLYHIGSITGEITNDEILGKIFSSFCIGK